MEGGHVAKDLRRIKIQALRNQGFGGLAELALLCQGRRTSNVVVVVVVVAG